MTPSLRWAIKRSFVDYVFRMPDGGGWVTDGATATEDNELVYEWVRSEATADGGFLWAFRGDVRFSGHAGLLFVRVADPWLSVLGDQATLSVVDPISEDGGRLDLVTVQLAPVETSGDGTTWAGDPVSLTAAGVGLFNDVYVEGELFAPLMVHLPPADTPNP
ncbi:HtaA domain-containing protein [Streptomyces plumbiresistens]|uniref:HtaA domain-containing protein n=1 Tax=Streptomyces plumbiresistens TaxID=511811 RepID=UPI0031ED1792